ncbi:NupC/NupG family nucleoside CNT transporter, partial [Bacillus licheniformis]|nr:NupC/NupG family nucleoside CNT transporter [Bacillus licheniformis]
LGILAIFAIAFLLSEHKSKINIRTILIGLAIQLLFGFIVLKWETGREAFLWFTKAVQHLVNYANEG